MLCTILLALCIMFLLSATVFCESQSIPLKNFKDLFKNIGVYFEWEADVQDNENKIIINNYNEDEKIIIMKKLI